MVIIRRASKLPKGLLDEHPQNKPKAMRHVEVELRARAATVAGGAQAGDLIAAATPHGLVAVTGTAGTIGMAGLTLGAIHRQWARTLSRTLVPSSLPGGYASLLGPNDHDQIALAYGSNIGRLRALKRRFDPDGLFTSAAPLPEDSTELPPRSYRIGSVASLS